MGFVFFVFCFNWFFCGGVLGFVFFCWGGILFILCLFLLLLLVEFGTWSLLCILFLGGLETLCVLFYFCFRGNLDPNFWMRCSLGDGEQVCFFCFWGEQIGVWVILLWLLIKLQWRISLKWQNLYFF